MVENPPITLLGDPNEANSLCGDAKIIGLELDILGEPTHFYIGATQKEITLADIVPLARTLSTKLASVVVEQLHKEGKSIACCKGCSVCCSRYLIPLSVPEAFRMRQEVLDMPADQRRAVVKSCLDASRTILDNKLESFDLNSSTTNAPTDVSQLNSWYAGLKLPCPFLSGGLCTIYEQRPTACREYLVTDSASLCETEQMDEPHVVMMPVRVVEALGQLAGELEGTCVEAVMLPLALPWAQENLQRHQRTWPAAMMAEKFVEIVKTIASDKSSAVTTPN